MKNKKIIILSIMFLVSLITLINPLLVNASTAPSTVKTISKSKMYYFSGSTDYISGYNFYRKELTDGTYAYCVSNISSKVPSSQTLTLKNQLSVSDKGLDYIIKNGYPHKSFTGNEKKDYYITQSAIWKYFDETKGSTNWKNTTFDSSSTGMKAYVYQLVQEAKVANNSEATEASINLIYLNKNMSYDSSINYYVSDLIKVSLTNTTGIYKVNIQDAPKGTIIKNQNGEIKEEFSNEESFRVYVPSESSKTESGTITLNVSATGITYSIFSYAASSSKYQDIAPVEIYEVYNDLISDNLVLSYQKEATKVKISKQDITTKEEVAGATLVIKDKSGNVVETWVSTTEPHYIEGLEAGDYTLTETIAPNGYMLSTETIKFTVLSDGSITSVVMYNAKESKTTKVKISKQDITTKEEVAGATLVIKDKSGNVVETWVSTTEPHYIEGLEAGDYTLTETIAPNGYMLSSETIEFKVLNDGSVTSVVMYNEKYVEVPITDLNISSSVIVIASLLMLSGLGLVIYYAKFSKQK